MGYDRDTVAIALHAQYAGTYQFVFSEYQGLVNQEVYLLDQEEDLIQNVKALTNYTFSLSANTTTANRFKLLFNASTTSVAALSNASMNGYPNPTNGIITLDGNGLTEGVCKIKVSSITGAEVLQTTTLYLKGAGIPISLKDLATGMYVVELTQENGFRARQKVFKN